MAHVGEEFALGAAGLLGGLLGFLEFTLEEHHVVGRLLQQGVLPVQFVGDSRAFRVDLPDRAGVPPDQDIEGDHVTDDKDRMTELHTVETRPLSLELEPAQDDGNEKGRGEQAAGHEAAGRGADQGGRRFASGTRAEYADAQDAEAQGGVQGDGDHAGNPVQYHGAVDRPGQGQQGDDPGVHDADVGQPVSRPAQV